MNRRLRDYYNPWFLVPFLLWVLVAAIMLLLFDRQVLFATVNTHHTPLLDRFMRRATAIGEAYPMIVVLAVPVVFRACRNWWYVVSALVCNVVPALVVQALKSLFDAPRPLLYFDAAPWIHIADNWERLYHRSFPSGHSAGAFSLCCFLSLILPKRWAWLGLPLFFVALLVPYTRLYLGAHFFADVFAGSIIGATVTLLCFALLRRYTKWPVTIGASSAEKNKPV